VVGEGVSAPRGGVVPKVAESLAEPVGGEGEAGEEPWGGRWGADAEVWAALAGGALEQPGEGFGHFYVGGPEF